MAAKPIETSASMPMHWLGTNAERIAMATTGLPVGLDFYETDTGDAYIWDGVAWCLL